VKKKTQNILIIFELLTLQDKASLGLVDGAARRCVGSVCYVFFFFSINRFRIQHWGLYLSYSTDLSKAKGPWM